MAYYESNNDFLSYEGRINRKNYIINMLILLALYICVAFLIKFESFSQYFSHEFFNTVLEFIVELFKFILIIAIMSLIYRRIADFSDFGDKYKKMFFILFFFPFLYINWGAYLLSFLPPLVYVLNISMIIILPIAIITAIVFAFLKSKN